MRFPVRPRRRAPVPAGDDDEPDQHDHRHILTRPGRPPGIAPDLRSVRPLVRPDPRQPAPPDVIHNDRSSSHRTLAPHQGTWRRDRKRVGESSRHRTPTRFMSNGVGGPLSVVPPSVNGRREPPAPAFSREEPHHDPRPRTPPCRRHPRQGSQPPHPPPGWLPDRRTPPYIRPPQRSPQRPGPCRADHPRTELPARGRNPCPRPPPDPAPGTAVVGTGIGGLLIFFLILAALAPGGGENSPGKDVGPSAPAAVAPAGPAPSR